MSYHARTSAGDPTHASPRLDYAPPAKIGICATSHSAAGRISTLALWVWMNKGHSGAFLSTMSPWNWEQGRLEYFQFDELRKVARFGADRDLRQANRRELEAAVGLPFLPDDDAYRPWRNYGRLFQIAMIATPRDAGDSRLTALGELLAKDGKVTTDEYLHFLAQATTQPSPALSGWSHTAR